MSASIGRVTVPATPEGFMRNLDERLSNLERLIVAPSAAIASPAAELGPLKIAVDEIREALKAARITE